MKTEIRNGAKKTEKEIEKLLKKMTLEEKIAMIHGATLFRSGGVPRLDIPGLSTSDGPMGVRPAALDASGNGAADEAEADEAEYGICF